VTPTEQTAKTPSPRTGFFATLRALLHADGTGVSKVSWGTGAPSPRRAHVTLAVLAATLAALAFTTAPAFAETHRGFTASFGSEGSEAGKLKEPAGVAVNDTTGDVYVVDRGNNRIDEFEADGTFIRAWGWGVVEGVGKKEELQTCTILTGCGPGVAGTGAGQLDAPGAIAVDNSGSAADPSKEDVYVTNTADNVVEKFSASGVFLGQIATGSGGAAFGGLLGVAVSPGGVVWVYAQKTGKPAGNEEAELESYSDAQPNAFVEAHESKAGGDAWPGIAVDSAGDFYVMHRDSRHIAKLKSNGEVIAEEVTGEGSTAVAVDPGDDVYINVGTVVQELGPAVEPVETFGSKHPVSGSGIAVGSAAGPVYVSDAAGATVDVFTLGSTPEAPKTEPASGETTSEATLHGVLNPGGATGALEYQFEYNKGPSCTGAQSTPLAEKSEAKIAAVEATVTGLQPGAEYTYCLVAFNAFGETRGNEAHFPTVAIPPEIISESTTLPVKATGATLRAGINPNNQATEYQFEYSTKATAETLEVPIVKVPSTPGTIPAGILNPGGEPVSAPTEPLTQGTTYFYRVVAENTKGEKATPGKVEHFTTAIEPELPETKPATEVASSSATLNGVLNPHAAGEVGTYKFLYNQGSSCEGGSETPAEPSTAAKEQKVSAKVTGLHPGEPYTFCLRAENKAGEFKLGSPQPLTLTPSLTAEATTNLTATSATLNAQVNPDGAEVTACQFEYGTTIGYGRQVACAPSPGSGTAAVPVSGQIEPLAANTTYHWRLLATNAAGTATSPDHTFNYATSAPELPDRRAYEMVTPPFKNGSLIGNCFACGGPMVSEDGSRVTAMTIQCFASSESCTGLRSQDGEPFQFTRTPSGWVTTAPAPPTTQFPENTPWQFNADQGTALFSMPTGPEGEDEWYARTSGGSFVRIGPATPPGATGTFSFNIGTNLLTGDLSHLVWNTNNGSKVFWPFDKERPDLGGNEISSAYEYVGAGNSQPFLIGVTGHQGSPDLISSCGTRLGNQPGVEQNALSPDGRIVYFTAMPTSGGQACPGTGANELIQVPVNEIYARVDGEGAAARTTPISEPQAPQVPASDKPHPECESLPCVENTSAANQGADWRDAFYVQASSDGSRVLFTSPQQLTDSASESGKSVCTGTAAECNLYESECPGCQGLSEGEELARRRLIDVSAGPGGAPVPGGPRVQGVVQAAADGSRVYFVAQGVLTGVEENQNHEKASEGGDNLYVYDAGHTAFIATLLPSDEQEWTNGGHPHLANVTPDGRFLVFTSHRALTADDTRPSPEGPLQVYRYDAQSAALVRVSIGNEGFNDNGNAGGGQATIVIPVSSYQLAGRSDPTMSHDGSYVFFQSPIGLTPHALNDVVAGEHEGQPFYAQNVYEYHEGHVYLISDGRDASSAGTVCQERFRGEPGGSAVCLLGAGASGHDVFFMTADQLVRSDTDTQGDVYDARICEPEHGNPCITEPPRALPPCGGEACHGIPAATPSGLAPGTATFNGEGNITPPPPPKGKTAAQIRAEKLAKALKACRTKRNKHKRKVCEAQARKRYGTAHKANKAEKATSNRRASR
jgi:DNA-binding beta-propeller fold protein YncE